MSMAVARQRGSIAEINITPMADVVIVLLIIMMMTVPLLKDGRVRNLPETVQAQNISGDVVLSVADDATLDIGGKPVLLSELPERLPPLLAASRESWIQLKVDRELAYSALAPVLSECRRAGASQISFVTLPKPGR